MTIPARRHDVRKHRVTFADAGAILWLAYLKRPRKAADARRRLEAAIEADEQLPEPQESGEGENDESAVSLPHRALPVIQLLTAAAKAKAKCNVMWDSSN